MQKVMKRIYLLMVVWSHILHLKGQGVCTSVFLSNGGNDTKSCRTPDNACRTWNRTLSVFNRSTNLTQFEFEGGIYTVDSSFKAKLHAMSCINLFMHKLALPHV